MISTQVKDKAEKYFDILLASKTGNILAISIIATFLVLSLIRLYPFQSSLPYNLKSVDDWGRYARFAMDIRHNGIAIPSLEENYRAPAGFLYNYFIALSFYLFGENTVPVFIIQNLLLGFSVALIYLTFRKKMTSLTSLIFLFTLFLFALVDVSKYYSFRLLSENLALFTVSAFFFCFIKGIEQNKCLLQLLASVLLGLSILIRPNIFPFEIILTVIALFYYRKAGVLKPFLFILFLTLSSSLLGIRNYIVSHRVVFLPTEGISFGRNFLSQEGLAPDYYLRKILFFLGFLSPLNPQYHWRPHWTIMWLGYFIYLYFRIKEDKKVEIWEITSHLYLFCYFSLLLFIAPQLGSYGFRLLIPAIFIVLPFSFMGLDKFSENIIRIRMLKKNQFTIRY